mgnify:CR=1 FL=1
MFWFYHMWAVFLILGLFLIFSYKQFNSLADGFFNYRIELDIKEWMYLKLISAEFLFLVSTLLLSVNLISIVRPFPIGWDDLWAYMNLPHLLAEGWSMISFWWMYSWQMFTGIWYMFNSPVQAFYLNNVGWFMSFIILVLITSDLLKSKLKKTYINIPMLVGTLFIALPMVVFQQAKDMKLDIGLFFVSIISIYLLYKYILKETNKTLWTKIKEKISQIPSSFKKGTIEIPHDLLFIWIIWILAWFAFTIKFTSLLLISALFWVLFFSRLWMTWFLWYLFLYFSIFTKGGLWSMMNVVYPKENIEFINIFSIISLVVWIAFLVFSIRKNTTNFKKLLLELGVFLLGTFISLSPWLSKNIYSSYPDISISYILNGNSVSFEKDYLKLYSETDLKVIKDNISKAIQSDDSVRIGEDYWRYFGYEKGINNYVKLPWNLTMQSNQWWEFTGISYLFLALLPIIFLFLPFKNRYFAFWVLAMLLLELLIYVIPSSRIFFTYLFSQFSLPWGYSIILAVFLVPLIYFVLTLKDTTKNTLFKMNLVFASFYTFLWTISAFGIVWYGITMYFNFLLMIAIGLYYLSCYKETDSEKEKQVKMFGSIIAFLIIVIYIFNSVFPHSFNNLKSASYKEYKLGDLTTAEASYLYHPEYLPILFELNIAEDKRKDFIKSKLKPSTIIGVKWIEDFDIVTLTQILRQLSNLKNELSNDAYSSLQDIYSGISNPKEEFKNKKWIYRIGTFLKYHISENNVRLLEDSLVTQFDNYIYTWNIDTTVDNIKKLWLWYLLVDLNAPTIDRDPRHALTTRYEKLLSIFTSENLELVETDSICLKIALESYGNSEKQSKDLTRYYNLAWVNYESYTDEWKIVRRWDKQILCYSYIYRLIAEDKVDSNNYSYLLGLKALIDMNKDTLNNDNAILQFLHSKIPAGYKVLFKVK